MTKEESIQNLIESISKAYDETCKYRPNVFRGHLRSISTDIEDGVALFVLRIIPTGYKIFIDPSIYVDGINHRPDLLVVNDRNEVVVMIEIKSNMGWCRNAKGQIDKIVNNNDTFMKARTLKCKFSNEGEKVKTVLYGRNVGLFLIAFTDKNCDETHHKENKRYAASMNVYQYNLCSGWYSCLSECEIGEFADTLKNLCV